MTTSILNINECFGPTVQGEGPHTGQRVMFLRLAGCNLSCSWCDTPYSWDWKQFDHAAESHAIDSNELSYLLTFPMNAPSRIVVTGGEPMLQQRGLLPLMRALSGISFDVETNGTISPLPEVAERVDLFCVSPKMQSARDAESMRIKIDTLKQYAALPNAIFKFVVMTDADLDEADKVATAIGVSSDRVWIMPEGANRATHLEHLSMFADKIIERGYNLSTRLHVLVWDQKRGV